MSHFLTLGLGTIPGGRSIPSVADAAIPWTNEMQKRVLLAVHTDLDQFEGVPGLLALDPQLVPRRAPECGDPCLGRTSRKPVGWCRRRGSPRGYRCSERQRGRLGYPKLHWPSSRNPVVARYLPRVRRTMIGRTSIPHLNHAMILPGATEPRRAGDALGFE